MKLAYQKHGIGIACCAVLLMTATTGTFAAPKAEHIATLHVDSGEVWWEPNRNSRYGFIGVCLSGPGGTDEKTFDYGVEEPNFPLSGDGLYTYELYKAPPGTKNSSEKKPGGNAGPVDNNGRTANQAAKKAPGQKYVKRGFIQSGSFSIEAGELVDPNLEEG